MTTLDNAQPETGDEANTKTGKWTGRIPAAIAITIVISIAVVMNVGLLELALELRAEYNN